MLAHFCLFYFFMCVQIKRENKLSCNQPAQQAFLCGLLEAKNQEQESKTARKMVQVKERGTGLPFPRPSPLFHFLVLVLFLARSKPKIPFHGLFLLRNQTETLATQAKLQQNGENQYSSSMFLKVMLNCLVLLTYNSFLAMSLKHYGGSQFFFNLQENVMTPALNS